MIFPQVHAILDSLRSRDKLNYIRMSFNSTASFLRWLYFYCKQHLHARFTSDFSLHLPSLRLSQKSKSISYKTCSVLMKTCSWVEKVDFWKIGMMLCCNCREQLRSNNLFRILLISKALLNRNPNPFQGFGCVEVLIALKLSIHIPN